jgi:hypothetical protein
MFSLESQNVMIRSCTVTMAHARSSRRGVAIGKIWFTLLKVGAGGGRWRERPASGFGCALVVRAGEKNTFVSASAVQLAVEALLFCPCGDASNLDAAQVMRGRAGVVRGIGDAAAACCSLLLTERGGDVPACQLSCAAPSCTSMCILQPISL